MRFLPVIVIILALDFYTFQAVQLLTQSFDQPIRNVIYLLFWSIPVITIVYLIFFTNPEFAASNKGLQSLLRAFIFIAYLSKVLIAFPLFIDDIRRSLLWLLDGMGITVAGYDGERSIFLSRLGLIIGVVPFVLLAYGMIRNPYRYKVFREKARIKGLPDALAGLKIVQISDIHSGSFTHKEPIRNAIDLINEEAADLVFFTGDLVNNVADEMADYMDVFDKIRAKYGVFSVLGNHDYGEYVRWKNQQEQLNNMEKLKGVHKELGWQLLLNEHRMLQVNQEKVAVIGVENYSAKPQFPRYGDLAKAHNGTDTASLKLLLSHDPSHWEHQVTRDFKDVAVTFSGHTHGMQFGIEIPGVIKWSPIKYMYKQWAGLYQKEDQFLYVNRGLGFLGYPGRVGILPEITVLELEKA